MGRTRRIGPVPVSVSLCAMASMASLVACTAPTRITQELNLAERAARPGMTSGYDEVIVGAGESITIRDALQDRTEYLCETGRPLFCSGLGRTRYCFCPQER